MRAEILEDLDKKIKSRYQQNEEHKYFHILSELSSNILNCVFNVYI